MTRISIIIPVYNKAAHVEQTINSVLAQTFTDFELIVVNDGSTDGSLEIVNAFDDVRISVINQKNNGLSNARNKGIFIAKGEIIALLDADDLWKKDHLETIFSLVKNFPEASLFGTGYAEVFANMNTIKPDINLSKTSEKPLIIPDFFRVNMHQPLVAPSSFAFKKEVVNVVGGFDPKVTYSEDVDFYIRANLEYKMAYDPKITCSYTMDAENQITRSKRSERTAPYFQKYLDKHPENGSLRHYINLKRYFLAIFYKVENRPDLFSAMREKLDETILSRKQRQLLNAPRVVVISLRFIKSFLLKKGKRLTSF